MPPLVIVSGPPAAGKTALAQRLSHDLELPVISKDLLKEAMMDHLGGAPEVGRAAFAVQFAVAKSLLESGDGLVLEGAFFVNQTEIAGLAALGAAVSVNLSCAIAELERRYSERHSAGHRHPSHRGLEALTDLRERVASGAYGIPDLGRPRLEVDTTAGFEPSLDEIVSWVRSNLL
ncbi:MAG TPA: AAA family ATPase [Candidatus Dormibacteraeota bacterium]|nr:AAA family ATPase [Candidatus Dormibacteraeota bacterium]